MVEKVEDVIWTDRELLKRVTAVLLEHDAQVEPNRFPASWVWLAKGGFAPGLDAAVKVWKNEDGTFNQPHWMFYASTSFLPHEIKDAFEDPDIYDKVVKQYQEKLGIS